ncbi:MAG: hypothetical protein WCX31_08015 [Salinivirgaceae bacterium]
MKNIRYFLFLFAALGLLSACNKNNESPIVINANNLLLGIWVNSHYIDTATIMNRSQNLLDTCDGFEFKADGTLIRRANSGDCATPPITYANYSGTWMQMPDKTIFIETEYWGGSTTFSLEIILVDETKLIYRQIISNN